VDQGFRNTCLSIAATGGHEALRLSVLLSSEHLHQSASARGGLTSTGATMGSISASIVSGGQCESHIWPYDPISPNPRPSALGTLYHLASALVLPFDLDVLRDEMEANRAVVVGLVRTRSFTSGTHRPIDLGPVQEPLDGRHAVVAVAFDDSRSTVTVKNSWGSAWGTAGYAQVSYPYLARHGLQLMSLVL
jgi:hypothetical protein